jgi:hypothetical protein
MNMSGRRWLWYSREESDEDSAISVLAVSESIIATGIGLWLVWKGFYWAFWSSIILTLVVHLRSPESTSEGVRLFNSFLSNRFVTTRIPHNADLLIPFSLERVIIIYVAALIIRIYSSLKYISIGVRYIPENWINLILKTDILTVPEIIPGLPKTHIFHAKNIFERVSDYGSRTLLSILKRSFKEFLLSLAKLSIPEVIFRFYGVLINIILTLSILLPSIVYRIILKSSFWLYLPLIWIATPPRGLRRDRTGQLVWSAAFARTPVDHIAFVLSLGGALALLWTLWDHAAYMAAANWAQEENFPAYWPLLLAGIDPTRVAYWNWLPGVAALLAVVVFIWAWQVSVSQKAGQMPSQLSLWFLSKANSLKNAASVATVALGLWTVFSYFRHQCLLPSILAKSADWMLPTVAACAE